MPFVIPPNAPSPATGYIPFAPETGAKYTLTSADGTVVSFNDATDANYCGNLTDVTGLDSADVRESADVLVQTDGGWHGNFWYGRRPITISGTCVNVSDAADRAMKLDKIRRVTNAMQNDTIISWLNKASGSVQMQTWVRRQQPVRFTGAWIKTFQLQLISQFAPLFSTATHVISSSGGALTAVNAGDYPSAPIIRITGPTSDPIVTNATTATFFRFLPGFVLNSGHYVDVDVLNRTATQDSTLSVNSWIDFNNSTWPLLTKGNNSFSFSEGSLGGITGGSFAITYRDTWT